MDNFKVIYKILTYLEKSMDFEESDYSCIDSKHLNIPYPRWAILLENLLEAGYIAGIEVTNNGINGRVVSFVSPKITMKGMEYLHDDKFMKQAEKQVKGIKSVVTMHVDF